MNGNHLSKVADFFLHLIVYPSAYLIGFIVGFFHFIFRILKSIFMHRPPFRGDRGQRDN